MIDDRTLGTIKRIFEQDPDDFKESSDRAVKLARCLLKLNADLSKNARLNCMAILEYNNALL